MKVSAGKYVRFTSFSYGRIYGRVLSTKLYLKRKNIFDNVYVIDVDYIGYGVIRHFLMKREVMVISKKEFMEAKRNFVIEMMGAT